MNRQKLIIFLTVFVDVVGLGLVIPTLPLYVEKFGASPFIITTFFAIFSLFQFFATPILGALSDKFGRRPVLIVSLFGTSLGWVIFALANSLPLLFLGRIIDGITGGNISTAQSYLVDISKTPRERTENLGLIGAAFGIGFIMGPALGAFLSNFGQSVPFWGAAILALINTFAAVAFLPETHTNRNVQKKISYNPFGPIVKGFRNKKLNLYLTAWFLFSMAITIHQTIFTLYLNRRFNLDQTHAGYLMTLTGIIVAINQGVLLRKFWLKRFKEPILEIAAMAAMIINFCLFTVPVFWVFMVSLLIMPFTQSIIRVVTNSQIVGASSTEDRGEIIGLTQGLMSLAGIIIPGIGGIIFEKNVAAPFFMAAIFMTIALMLIFRDRSKVQVATLVDGVPPTV